MQYSIDFNGLEIAIIEDDPHALRGLQASVEMLGCQVVWTARSDTEAMAAADKQLPQIAFVDLRLVKGSDDYAAGWQLIKYLHQKKPDGGFKAIIYSGTPVTDGIVLEAIRLGCSYIVKQDLWDHDLELLTGALMAACSDSVFLSNEVSTGVESLFVQLQEADLLSDREWETLKLVTTGMSNKEISKRLFIAEATVKSHVSSILSKLSLDNRGQAADWYRRQNR